MAELLACRSCGAAWSAPAAFSPILTKYIWCNDCGGQSFIPIGEVYGISRPPVHIGVHPPAPTHRTPLLMLTDAPANPSPPAQTPAPQTSAGPRQAPVNQLPPGPAITLHASESQLNSAFRSHTEGDLFSFPPAALVQKYFPRSGDWGTHNNQLDKDSKTYARIIAIYLVEVYPDKLKLQVNSPKGNTYQGAAYLRRNMQPTLLRIAKGEPIAKALNNAAYNNDGGRTTHRVQYDRYGRNYKGPQTNSKYLPQPSTSANYWEFYVDRDGTSGQSGLSMGTGRPGVERLFFGPPDYVYYTWNHYGSDVPFGRERSALTDADIWAVFSFSQKQWVFGLTR